MGGLRMCGIMWVGAIGGIISWCIRGESEEERRREGRMIVF